jgi:hypothetical protein
MTDLCGGILFIAFIPFTAVACCIIGNGNYYTLPCLLRLQSSHYKQQPHCFLFETYKKINYLASIKIPNMLMR